MCGHVCIKVHLPEGVHVFCDSFDKRGERKKRVKRREKKSSREKRESHSGVVRGGGQLLVLLVD
jgi:hypothetical protein